MKRFASGWLALKYDQVYWTLVFKRIALEGSAVEHLKFCNVWLTVQSSYVEFNGDSWGPEVGISKDRGCLGWSVEHTRCVQNKKKTSIKPFIFVVLISLEGSRI